MSRRSSSKTNARSRSIDEDGIEQGFLIGERTVPGRGTETKRVRIEPTIYREAKTRIVTLEQSDRESSKIISLNTVDEIRRLKDFLTMALEQSA
jgi:hypothetical protein